MLFTIFITFSWLRVVYILSCEGVEGEIELDYDLEYQIPWNHLYELNDTSHHYDDQEGEEDINKNYECPECCDNFKTKCELRTHVGR